MSIQNSIIGQNFGLAVVNDDESAEMIELFAARFHCVFQGVSDRMLALEIARRARPFIVIADCDLLTEHLQDFISRLSTRWPTLEIIIIRESCLVPQEFAVQGCETAC